MRCGAGFGNPGGLGGSRVVNAAISTIRRDQEGLAPPVWAAWFVIIAQSLRVASVIRVGQRRPGRRNDEYDLHSR
jgi:hypothetical protein